MTNLNSISSSLSSIDTISRLATNPKTSVDNLMTIRRHSLASTSLLWPNDTSDRRRKMNPYKNGSICLSSTTALNITLVILLLLTIARQIFDFLGQIWLQIVINFFTIILIIVALFGVHQHRKSYLALFLIWSIVNICWNFVVICIHTKLYDTHLTEDNLNFFTGTTSWWHSNGPGCLPYNISSIQAATSNQYALMQPYAITGCRIDYHFIESTQAAVHVFISMLAFILCCYVMYIYPYRGSYYDKNTSDQKLYHLNQIPPDRLRVDSNPYPGSKLSTSASLRRPTNRTGTRSSQHSMSSMRSTRRRLRQASDSVNLPSQRGSTSSAQKNYKTGSLSSRRSRRSSGKRSDQSSLTYATATSVKSGNRSSQQRGRLSSLSSNDYLPSYQPPHSSNANLLSSYGELLSLDGYNNQMSNHPSNSRVAGNSNPTYSGSHFSLYSHGSNASKNVNGNYDNIYGDNSQNGDGESLYSTHTNKHRSNQQLNQTDVKSRRSSMRYNQNKDQQNNPQRTTQTSNMVPSVYGVNPMKPSMNGTNSNGRYDHYSKTNNQNNNHDTQNYNGGDTNSRTQHQKATSAKHHAAMKISKTDYHINTPQTFTQRQSPVYFNSETPI